MSIRWRTFAAVPLALAVHGSTANAQSQPPPERRDPAQSAPSDASSSPPPAESPVARAAASDADRIRALEERVRALEHPRTTDAEEGAPISSATQGTSHTSTPASLTLSGYVEAFYQWNFNNPSNGISNYRGFDNLHNTFAISNVVLDASGVLGPVTARLALQAGTTPDTYYLVEGVRPGTSATGTSEPTAWRFVQQANVGWRAPVGRGLLLEAGIFLSPIGPEGIAVHEQWNWSRSTLFFGLPLYHAGLRASYPVTARWTISVGGYNGWNSIIDSNPEKSFSVAADYVVTDHLTFHMLYFGGVERSAGAPERQNGALPWRNLFDAYVAIYPRSWLSLLVHANAGFEPNAFGTSWWTAAALYVRVQPLRWLYLAARGDAFYESVPSNAIGVASPIFWPSPWVGSGTGTVDLRPAENLSVRIEYRHDEATAPLYFAGVVPIDAVTRAAIPNARSQDTVTLGVTAWF